MLKFAMNFAVAFASLVALAGFALGICVGPIFALIWLDVPALPFGLPILIGGWCAVGGLAFAISEARKPA